MKKLQIVESGFNEWAEGVSVMYASSVDKESGTVLRFWARVSNEKYYVTLGNKSLYLGNDFDEAARTFNDRC